MELLAHASAPSSRKHDERFKRQAQAYSTFKVAEVTNINRNMRNVENDLPKISVAPVKTPARKITFDPDVYLDDTQLAYTALDSQLLTSSQRVDEIGDEDVDEDEEEDDDEEVPLALPLDSSRLDQLVSEDLPNDSSQIHESNKLPSKSIGSGRLPLSSVPRSSRSHGQGHYMPSPILPDEDTTYGGFPTTAEMMATPSRRQPPEPDSSSQSEDLPKQHHRLAEQSWSSPSDDIPSQLPSTYSISDMHSDRSEGPVTSSPWGHLPGGTAPAGSQSSHDQSDAGSPSRRRMSQATTRAGYSSPSKGAKTDGLHRPIISSPLKKTQSSSNNSSNTFAPIRFFFRQDAISSVSLDRAVQPKSIETSRIRKQGTSSSLPASTNPRLPLYQVRKSSSSEVEDNVGGGSAPATSSPVTKMDLFPDDTESPFEKQVPLSSAAVPETVRNPRLISSSPILDSIQRPTTKTPTAPLAVTSSMPTLSTSTNPKPHEPTKNHSLLTSGVSTPKATSNALPTSSPIPPTTSLIAAKKRKFASFSTPKPHPTSQDLHVLSSLPRSLHPPPPPTSTQLFVSHITPYLRKTYNNEDTPGLKGRYKPLRQTRELEKSERGYWEIETKDWSVKLQIKFWKFLEVEVHAGGLGWGVWCHRESETDNYEGKGGGGVVNDADDDSREEQRELGKVKVFCWGEIVGFVWLLIYVASESKLRFVETKWVDADGEVVIKI